MEIIVILGMHRSGTSCLTGCLQQLGLQLGEVSEFNEYNIKGNKEDDSIGLLNEKLLRHNGGSWRKPPNGKIKWTQEHEKLRDEILTRYMKLPSPVGIKDPRMLFTLPFWQQKLPKLSFLGSFRHPLNVAKSLHARKNIRIEIPDGLILWKFYNLKLLELQKTYKFDLINFDLESIEYLRQVMSKAKNINLEKSHDMLDFFDDKLRNQNINESHLDKSHEEIMLIYKKLLKTSKEFNINNQEL